MNVDHQHLPVSKRRDIGLSDAEVVEEAEKGRAMALRELAYRRIPSSLRILRDFASAELPKEISQQSLRLRARAKWTAKVSLCRLGDKEYLPEILAGLKSPDPFVRLRSMGALTEIGDKRAAKYLGPFLADKTSPPGSGCVVYFSIGDSAASLLAILFPEVHEALKRSSGKRFIGGDGWLGWWKENESQFLESME